jgi:hypothetical protein
VVWRYCVWQVTVVGRARNGMEQEEIIVKAI